MNHQHAEPSGRARPAIAVLIPADPARPPMLTQLDGGSPAVSEALGGGPVGRVLLSGSLDGLYAVYGQRPVQPDRNLRAAAMVAHLGHSAPDVRRELCGAVLVVGRDAADSRHCDVPAAVLHALQQTDLLAPAPRGDDRPSAWALPSQACGGAVRPHGRARLWSGLRPRRASR